MFEQFGFVASAVHIGEEKNRTGVSANFVKDSGLCTPALSDGALGKAQLAIPLEWLKKTVHDFGLGVAIDKVR